MDVSISDPLLPSHKNPAWQILKVMEFSPIHLVCFRIKSKTQVFEFKVWEGVCVCVCVCVSICSYALIPNVVEGHLKWEMKSLYWI